MFEIELARKMSISLDDVYKLSAQFPQLFDGFEAVHQEAIDELEEELEQCKKELSSYQSDKTYYEDEIRELREENECLSYKIAYLEDLIEELGGDVE